MTYELFYNSFLRLDMVFLVLFRIFVYFGKSEEEACLLIATCVVDVYSGPVFIGIILFLTVALLSFVQLLTMQKELQKQMTMMVAVPVTKEGRRLEAALGRSMEKAVKANNDALWARFQEENAKNEKLLRDRNQQITSLINNFMNKDFPVMLEKMVKKELAVVGPAVARAITPAIEKAIPPAISDSFQVRILNDLMHSVITLVYSYLIDACVAERSW